MEERKLLSARDTGFVRENMHINYCLNDEDELLIESFVRNNGIELKFDLSNFYFFITGVHLKFVPKYTPATFTIGIDRTLQLYEKYDRVMAESGYYGNTFLIKVDNSKQVGVIFSPSGQAACGVEEMAQRLLDAYMEQEDPYFAREFASTSYAGPYSGYEQISAAFRQARRLNDLLFFGVRGRIITEAFRRETARKCDTMAVLSNMRRLLHVVCTGTEARAVRLVDHVVDTMVAPSYSMRNFFAMQSTFEDMLDIMEAVYPVKLRHREGRSFLMLEDCRRYMHEEIGLLFAQLKGVHRYSPILLLALSYINKNFTDEISLSQLSEYVYVNASTLSSEFNQEMGMSLSDYVAALRVRRAEELLRESELTVAEIAQQVGFVGVKYFREVFKRTTGKTPAEIRRSGRAKGAHERE